MTKLKGKNCVITGAASGIGKHLALGLAREGMNLFISDIDMEDLDKVKTEIEVLGVTVHAARCDISKFEDFQNLATEVHSKMGDVDMLINNAGISGGGYLENYTLEDWKLVLDVNLWGVIHSLKVFLPKMIARGSGHIVNTASGAGIIGLPNHLHYVASKFAVVGISEGLYSELAEKGIDVSVICPSHVKTNIIDKSSINIPPELLEGKEQSEIDEKLKAFKSEFWEDYNKGSQSVEQVAKKYIRGIKKKKLYIFDRRIIPAAMFIKAISQRLYKRILRREGRRNTKIINTILSKIGLT